VEVVKFAPIAQQGNIAKDVLVQAVDPVVHALRENTRIQSRQEVVKFAPIVQRGHISKDVPAQVLDPVIYALQENTKIQPQMQLVSRVLFSVQKRTNIGQAVELKPQVHARSTNAVKLRSKLFH